MIANTPAAWDERARAKTSWDAAMWSELSQGARFMLISEMLEGRIFIDTEESVLDYGCGTGAFITWLPLDDVQYYGFDWSPGMRARARHDHPRAVVLDELDDDLVFDHVVCIGPFNLADNWSKEQTWETIEELWTMHTRRSLVVSLFRARAQTPSGMLAYTPTDVAELVERLQAKSFVIHADHLPNDLILGAWRDDDRHGAPAELPARHVGAVEDQGV